MGQISKDVARDSSSNISRRAEVPECIDDLIEPRNTSGRSELVEIWQSPRVAQIWQGRDIVDTSTHAFCALWHFETKQTTLPTT